MMKRKNKSRLLFQRLAVRIFLLAGICGICGGGCGGRSRPEEAAIGNGSFYIHGKAEDGERAECGEDGLPDRAQGDGGGAMEESRKAAESYRDIYEKALEEGTLGSLETVQDMVNRLGEYGYCALDRENENQVNLTNPGKIEAFCRAAEEGGNGHASIFSVTEDGGFIRFGLEASQNGVLVTRSVLHWNGEMPEVDYTNRYLAYEWIYSKNGYLFFREYVPQGYDGAQGYTAIRVEPLEEKCREYNRKYILPVGYNANDMFLSDWTEEDFGTLDFDDLFAKLYGITFGTGIPYEQTVDGKTYLVPEKEYETVILSHFRMDETTLRANARYVEKDMAYQYRSRGFYDCASSPNNPYPEVVACEDMEDGTVKLTVNAVWPKENLDRAFSHEVVIRLLEDGGFQYVSNRVIPDEENVEPVWYTEKETGSLE